MITSYEARLIREKEKRRILDELDIGGNISANDMIVKQYKEIERIKTELQDTNEHLGEYLHEQEEENNRLNNIINELEKHLQNEISKGRSEDNMWLMGCYDEDREILDKIKELKGVDKE